MNVRRVVSEQIFGPTDNDLKINLQLTWDHQPGEAYSLYRLTGDAPSVHSIILSACGILELAANAPSYVQQEIGFTDTSKMELHDGVWSAHVTLLEPGVEYQFVVLTKAANAATPKAAAPKAAAPKAAAPEAAAPKATAASHEKSLWEKVKGFMPGWIGGKKAEKKENSPIETASTLVGLEINPGMPEMSPACPVSICSPVNTGWLGLIQPSPKTSHSIIKQNVDDNVTSTGIIEFITSAGRFRIISS